MFRSLALASLAVLAACTAGPAASDAAAEAASTGQPFAVQPVATFDEPWAMTFLPDGRMLVTEKEGRLKLLAPGSAAVEVAGVPKVAYGGQGGLGDVVLHPDFANNGYVYLSYAEAGDGGYGAAVARGRLLLEGSPRIEGMQVIWRQEPKVSGRGHYGHRIAFGPDGMMYVSSGERQKFDPSQDMSSNMGKVVRLTDSGMVPSDNPFYDKGRVTSQIWSSGHRNPLGLAFDARNRLWVVEMGPAGGDELNLVKRGANYGYPTVSNGDHYDGRDIPDHSAGDGFEPPKITWTPVISPGGFIIYSGSMFPAWNGSGLVAGLSGEALVRVAFDGEQAREAERFPMGARIREVEQGPDGAVWLLEDGNSGGRLLKLTPR
jgi:aldose sugar dehydrogenase